MLIFSFVMGFVMGGKMAFIFLFTIPVLGIGLFFVTKKTMPLFRRVFRKYDALNASVQEKRSFCGSIRMITTPDTCRGSPCPP